MNHNFRYFKKNLLLFLFPLLIPIFILGTFSIVITKNYVEKEIRRNNLTLLQQVKDNIELVFDEMNSLYMNLGNNPDTIVTLKKILNNPHPSITLDEYRFLSATKSFIDSPANARPYIQSIYVYFNNAQRRFLVSRRGLVYLNQFSDQSWYYSHLTHHGPSFRTELRSIVPVPLTKFKVKVLTIYRTLNSPGFNSNMGVIVLNIRLSYIKDLLRHLKTIPGKSTLIINENGDVVFKNGNLRPIKNSILIKLLNKSTRNFELNLAKQKYMVTQLASEKYHWKYYFIIPTRIFYNVPNRLQQITSLLLLCSFLISVIITYYLAQKSHKHITNIISIIDSAKNGSPLPQPPSSIEDEFSYISYNLLMTFIEQNYLKIQLSERKYRLHFMELLALQSQINPHFLFNTLETIKWKVIQYTKKPNETSNILEELSRILKYSLESPGKKVTLREEIANTRNYIEIQKVRYRDKFDAIWKYDESVLNCSVIRLIIQPLIENSIYHGIKPLDKKCLIKIKIYQRNQILKITVIDNGLGISKEKLHEVRNKLKQSSEDDKHIGLYNTSKRLELFYGDKYEIKIRGKEGLGTAVNIRIPFETEPSDSQVKPSSGPFSSQPNISPKTR